MAFFKIWYRRPYILWLCIGTAFVSGVLIGRWGEQWIRHDERPVVQKPPLLTPPIIDPAVQPQDKDDDNSLAQAQSNAQKGDYLSALNLLYELYHSVQDDIPLSAIKASIRQLIVRYEKELNNASHLEPLLELYQFLTIQEPDHPGYFYRLATIQWQMKLYYDALASLTQTRYHPLYAQKTKDLIIQIEREIALAGHTEISLIAHKDQFIVRMNIPQYGDVNLLLDTGASITTLTPHAVHRLRLPQKYREKIQINTVGGSIRAPIIQIPALAVGNIIVPNLVIGITPLEGFSNRIDGLLGMNYLSQFTFFIDQNKGILYLSSR